MKDTQKINFKICFVLGILVVFLIGCSPNKNKYRDLASIKTDTVEPEGCQKLGVVTGATLKETSLTQSYKAAILDLKKLAYDQGANFIFLKRMSLDSKFISGIAYRCKN